MTIPLTGAQGLFTRLGSIFGIFKAVNLFRGTTVPPRVNTVQAEFTTTDQATVEGIYSSLLSYQTSSSGFMSALQSLANNVTVQMANDDMPQTSQNSLKVAMSYMINQMILSSSTVLKCNASATVVPYVGNTGNGVLTATLTNNLGVLQECVFAETIAARVTQDSQSGGAFPGSESITLQGQYSVPDSLSWLYPVGSGSSTSIQCINPTISQSRGNQNFLANSNFESWVANPNVPDAWTVAVGTPGTTIKKSTSIFYDGLSSLNFVGNGSELTAVYQAFGVPVSGTATTVLPTNLVAFNAWIRMDSTPAAGVLAFSLVDQTGTPILSAAGVAQTITKSLPTVSSTWVNVSGHFRTPRVLPTQVRLQIKLTTALTTSRNLYIDRVGLAQPYQLYPGGPFVAAFSGNVNLILGDNWTATVFNDYAGQFQYIFDRFFNMKQLGLQLPSSGTPSIPDSLTN